MSFLNSKKLCVAAMIVMMVGSTMFNGVSQVNRLASPVISVFTNGNASSHGYGIQYSLNKRAEAAQNILSLTTDVVGASNADYVKAQKAINDMSSTTDVSDLYDINMDLQAAVDALYTTAYPQLSKTKADSLKEKYALFNSEQEAIGYDQYNSLVTDYYNETSGILGGLFRMFASNVEYFK